MIKATLRNQQVTCSTLKNKGKTIYCDKSQFPLEKIQHIVSPDTFEVTFYSTFRVFEGDCFESVEEVERLDEKHKPIYKLQLSNGKTKEVQGTIKEVSD